MRTFCFFAIAFFMLAGAKTVDAGEPPEKKNVLILYGERPDLPAILQLSQAFREGFSGASSPDVEWFSEYFDFARFPATQNDEALTRYVKQRYAGRKIDLVLPVAGQALDFVLRHRQELFPGVPIVFLVLNPKDVDVAHLPPDATGIAAHQDIARTIELAQRLQPGAREIVVVSGSSDLDKKLLQQTGPVLDALAPKIKWRAIAERSLAEAVEEERQVPKEDIVLVLSMIRDREGRSVSIPELVRKLAPVSKAPIYGVTGTITGTGAVGGALVDFNTYGKQAAALALRVLNGKWVAYGSPELNIPNPVIVDWRALKHWNLPEAKVSPEATMMFRQPTLWEEHEDLIFGILAVVLAQSATIAGLLIQRTWWRRSEESLRASEQQMNLASQSANLGLWVRELTTGKIFATEKFRELLGFTPDEVLTYETILARLHKEDREPMRRAVQRAITERTFYNTQYRVVHTDGSEHWIGSMGQAAYDKNGKAIRTFGVSTDITQRRHTEQELQTLRQELAHVDRVTMLGQLASALAHELNQPLGAILRNAEAAELFLKMERPDLEEVHAALIDIRKDDQRAGEVIERMGSLLRRRDVKSEILDVGSLVRDVAALVRPDAVTRSVVIDIEISGDLPPVRGDRVQCQQVLLNLILNGMDALNGQATGERSVGISAKRDGAGTVEIAVSDTGHGIPPEKISKLFEPFFTTKAQGMGIGLSISRTIVEAHGGHLSAENNAERGATFRVKLPVAKEGPTS